MRAIKMMKLPVGWKFERGWDELQLINDERFYARRPSRHKEGDGGELAVAGVEPWRCFLARQLYACNSSERDEVIFLWRLVRFELVMTQNLSSGAPALGLFFHSKP
jgi:hypothetical protein